MIVQEGSVLKYLNFRNIQSTLGFSVDQTDHIMELANKWSPTGNFRKVETPFRIDFAYKKELTEALPLTEKALHNSEK